MPFARYPTIIVAICSLCISPKSSVKFLRTENIESPWFVDGNRDQIKVSSYVQEQGKGFSERNPQNRPRALPKKPTTFSEDAEFHQELLLTDVHDSDDSGLYKIRADTMKYYSTVTQFHSWCDRAQPKSSMQTCDFFEGA